MIGGADRSRMTPVPKGKVRMRSGKGRRGERNAGSSVNQVTKSDRVGELVTFSDQSGEVLRSRVGRTAEDDLDAGTSQMAAA